MASCLVQRALNPPLSPLRQRRHLRKCSSPLRNVVDLSNLVAEIAESGRNTPSPADPPLHPPGISSKYVARPVEGAIKGLNSVAWDSLHQRCITEVDPITCLQPNITATCRWESLNRAIGKENRSTHCGATLKVGSADGCPRSAIHHFLIAHCPMNDRDPKSIFISSKGVAGCSWAGCNCEDFMTWDMFWEHFMEHVYETYH